MLVSVPPPVALKVVAPHRGFEHSLHVIFNSVDTTPHVFAPVATPSTPVAATLDTDGTVDVVMRIPWRRSPTTLSLQHGLSLINRKHAGVTPDSDTRLPAVLFTARCQVALPAFLFTARCQVAPEVVSDATSTWRQT